MSKENEIGVVLIFHDPVNGLNREYIVKKDKHRKRVQLYEDMGCVTFTEDSWLDLRERIDRMFYE